MARENDHRSTGQRENNLAIITFNCIPSTNYTFKYERLGRMALENRRLYCEHHGYRFISDVPVASDRPACWAKIPALLKTLDTHSWALWADSDTLIFNRECRLEKFCDPKYELVVQSHEEFYRFIGMPLELGLVHNTSNEQPTQRGYEISFEIPLLSLKVATTFKLFKLLSMAQPST